MSPSPRHLAKRIHSLIYPKPSGTCPDEQETGYSGTTAVWAGAFLLLFFLTVQFRLVRSTISVQFALHACPIFNTGLAG